MTENLHLFPRGGAKKQIFWRTGITGGKTGKNTVAAPQAAKEKRMIKGTRNLPRIKEEIRGFYGQNVRVHVNLGRNKTSDFTGTLTGIYPALFTVSPDDKNYLGKTSYSYSEVLCGSVKVTARK